MVGVQRRRHRRPVVLSGVRAASSPLEVVRESESAPLELVHRFASARRRLEFLGDGWGLTGGWLLRCFFFKRVL